LGAAYSTYEGHSFGSITFITVPLSCPEGGGRELKHPYVLQFPAHCVIGQSDVSVCRKKERS